MLPEDIVSGAITPQNMLTSLLLKQLNL